MKIKNILGNSVQCMLLMSVFLFVIGAGYEAGMSYTEREHGYVLTTEQEFTESSGALSNPDRGFYSVYGFLLSEGQDTRTPVMERLRKDEKALALIQINLRNYTGGEISPKGLELLEVFFQELREQEKRYILRFLYDWNGANAETEPEDVEIILNHMRQLEPLLREYSDMIFLCQGLFIGNWGEMNGTRHLDSMQQLALQLAAVTEESTFLAVRMPSQWRNITGLPEITTEAYEKSSLVRRLGLFNDGIMGNNSDYGTYSSKSKTEAGMYASWNREEEIAFQQKLCCLVPNGGEVIVDNPVNDFSNALQNLAAMHITYLNWEYDREVLEKWADSTVTEEGCFYGMDGLTYIERHLGYRLLIADAGLKYRFWEDKLSISIQLQNAGFAPLYQETELMITVKNKKSGEIKRYLVPARLRELAGGTEAEELLTLTGNISLAEYAAGTYEIFLSIKETHSGLTLELANEQKPEEYGYRLGSFTVKEVPAGIRRLEEWFQENAGH